MKRITFDARHVRALLASALVALAAGWLGQRAWGELQSPGPAQREITTEVVKMLQQHHISRRPIDDEISQRCLAKFLKSLDLYKVYFYQSDVDEFMRHAKQIDDDVKKGDVKFAYDVFQRFLKRVDERVKWVDELLKQPHDFTVDEELIIDPDATQYARTPAEARELWRKRIKYDLLVLKADAQRARNGKKTRATRPDEDPVARLTRRYHSFAQRMHQTDDDELLEMYLNALTESFDPHTSYMSPASQENFDIQMRLNLEGIGAALSYEDGYTVVSKIIPGGAADKEGHLKPKDRIIGVGQGPDGPIEDTVNMKLSDVVDRIRGKAGTVVRLQVVPADGGETAIYSITRARIELKDAEARSVILEEQVGDQTFRLGVISLPSFYMDMQAASRGDPDFKSTTRDVARLLEDFRAKQVDCVVLDLRENGGGSLTEAISLTGLFLDVGPVVQVRDKDGKVDVYYDLEEGTAWDGPLVVLTSRLSASASEIFAGAMQDYGRGLIVGDCSTHGKGTVQSLRDLAREIFRVRNPRRLGALKITVQKFYRPSGDSTQNRGVEADVPLPALTAVWKGLSESDLEYSLAFDRIAPAEFTKLDMVDRAMIEELNRRSLQRRLDSAGFQRIERSIARYKEQQERTTVTLNEAKFLAERAELDAEREQERRFERMEDPNRPIFDLQDDYNREVVAITLDYLRNYQQRAARGLVGGKQGKQAAGAAVD
jgi:carboxyl-terminal processing protease